MRTRAAATGALEVRVKSDDQRVLTSHLLGDDGKWRQFMTATYRRTK